MTTNGKETKEVAKIAPAFDAIVTLYDDNRLGALQGFRQFLNRKPASSWITDSYDKKYKTFKIGDLMQLLDMVYFCQWSTKNFRYETISNEIVGVIELHVTNPLTQHVRVITGTAAIVIMVDKGADPMDITRKKAKALETGFPKLSAMCLKNAARQLGTLFGRDINREVSLDAPDVVSIQESVIDSLIEENTEV